MRKLILIICQFLVFAGFIYSQNTFEKVETYKFAYIDFRLFDDKDKGIIQYTKALDLLEMMDCFPAPCPKEDWIKREKVVMEPLRKHISSLITEIENKNNLKILRINDDYKGDSILALDKEFDLTEKYISFYNAMAEKQKITIDFTVSKSKIGVIDTHHFFDKLNGIKSFAEFRENNNLEYICGKTYLCREIGISIQSFAYLKGFGIILNSSKELPNDLKDLKIIDVTKEFISEYNKSNK